MFLLSIPSLEISAECKELLVNNECVRSFKKLCLKLMDLLVFSSQIWFGLTSHFVRVQDGFGLFSSGLKTAQKEVKHAHMPQSVHGVCDCVGKGWTQW